MISVSHRKSQNAKLAAAGFSLGSPEFHKYVASPIVAQVTNSRD
jgi:hypothetical protein